MADPCPLSPIPMVTTSIFRSQSFIHQSKFMVSQADMILSGLDNAEKPVDPYLLN